MDPAVGRVADDGMADGAQVNTDLMRAPCVNRHLTEREPWQMMRARDPSDGVSRAARPRGHLQSIRRIASDRRFDAAARLHDAPHERDVLFLDFMVVKLTRELVMRRIILGNDHQARSAAIESVHDAGAKLAADATEILEVVQQGVDDRARCVTCTGMHDHPGRFVQHRKVSVLIDDVEWKRFARKRRRRRRRHVDADLIPFTYDEVRLRFMRSRASGTRPLKIDVAL